MRVVSGRTKCEFAHVQGAKVNDVCGVEPLQNGGCDVWTEVGKDPRATGRHFCSAEEHIFMGHRYARERMKLLSFAPRVVNFIGRIERSRAANADESIKSGLQIFDACKARFGQFAGRKLAAGQGIACLA